VALVVADAEYVFEGNEVFINFYGCNLSSGFSGKSPTLDAERRGMVFS